MLVCSLLLVCRNSCFLFFLRQLILTSLLPKKKYCFIVFSQWLSTTQQFAYSPPCCDGMGKRLGSVKLRKLIGCDSLISERKRKKTEGKANCLSLSISTLMPNLSPSNGCLFKNLLPSVFVVKHDVTWHGITALQSLWVSCPGCVPS